MEFRLLGPLEVEYAGEPLVIGRRRERALLGLLLLEANHVLSDERLVDLLWDDDPPQAARTALRAHVSRLRTALNPPGSGEHGVRVVRRAEGYQALAIPSAVDAHRFQELVVQARAVVDPAGRAATLRQALRLWRGPLLADCASEALRRRIGGPWQEARWAATQEAIDAELACGRHRELIGELFALAAEHPLRERFHELLMLALYRAGRQTEALGVYQQVRAHLIEEAGVEPGAGLKRLHERMLRADPELLQVGHTRQAVPDGTGLRQLPAGLRHFTGRHTELEVLDAVLRNGAGPGGAVGICAIDGMGGVGKTALAVHAGHLLADRFPDGALFLELHTHTVGVAARTAFDVQGAALVMLGVAPQAIPADPDARAAAYRGRLAGTRMLVVIDDARDEAQVRTLLPGTGDCLVLVTSRNRLKALDDAEALRLDVLAQDEAVELFCKTAGSDRTNTADPAVLQIVQLCGSLPLAVRIAGALLRARPAWTPQHLLADFTENLAGLEAFDDGQRRLPTVLDMSYRHLPEPARVLFRRLGQIPGPDADSYAAAALLNSDPKTVDRLLGLLADRSMLTEHTVGRWRMHDLLREHADALANTEDTLEQRRDALDRLLHYYAYTAQTASAPIARTPRPVPDGPAPAHAPDLADPDTARAWLRTEHPNLDAAFTHAHASRLHRHTAALAAGMAEVLRADGPWARALEVHQAAEAATRNSPPATRANILNELGRVRHRTGDLPGAADAQTQALQIYRQIGNPLGEAIALTDLGLVRQRTGDLPGAADAQTQALQIYRQIGNPLGEAITLTDLGQVRHLTGDLPGAADAQTQALQIYRQIGNRHGEAYALTELGRVRLLTGDLPGAADANTQALQIFRQIGNRLGEAIALTELGRVRLLTGDLPGAADAQMQALQIFRQIGNPVGEANALIDLGQVRQRTGDLPGAADAQMQALQIFRQIGSRGNEAWALNFYAATIAALGDRPQALTLYQQALDMNRELKKPDDEAISLEGIADHHLNTGNPEKGIAYLNQALEIFQRLGMRPDIERVQARLGETSGQ